MKFHIPDYGASISWGDGGKPVIKHHRDGRIEMLGEDGEMHVLDPACSQWLFMAFVALTERMGMRYPGHRMAVSNSGDDRG